MCVARYRQHARTVRTGRARAIRPAHAPYDGDTLFCLSTGKKVIEDPAMRQIAALPYTTDADGAMQILLITSRDTGRWVIPKGNRIKGLAGHRAAEVEAFEEAGIHGIACPAPIGRYSYDKRKRSGKSREANVEVFPLAVTGHLTQWPEKGQRELRWFHALMPKQGRFFEQFEDHAATLVAGADALAKLLKGGPDMDAHIKEISDREHEADDIIREVLTEVRHTFLTPFDRGAITGLIAAMDDVAEVEAHQRDVPPDMVAEVVAMRPSGFAAFQPVKPGAGATGAVIDMGHGMQAPGIVGGKLHPFAASDFGGSIFAGFLKREGMAAHEVAQRGMVGPANQPVAIFQQEIGR